MVVMFVNESAFVYVCLCVRGDEGCGLSQRGKQRWEMR